MSVDNVIVLDRTPRALAPSATNELDGDTRYVHTGSSSESAPGIGSKIGRYVVIGELGRGGMGIVLRAYDPKLQREVALKCLRPDALSAELQARLVREAQAMARLSHANVVAVYDVDLDGEHVTVAMEYVQARTLEDWLRTAAPKPAEIVAAFIAAGRGLAAAHAAGLLHRDFKPSNVLVSHAGVVKVTDFGLARFDDEMPTRDSHEGSIPPPSTASGEVTRDLDQRLPKDLASPRLDRLTDVGNGMVMGTPAYMAPEQHHGDTLTAAVDQYAFCVSLWLALTGGLPFPLQGKTLRQLVQTKRRGPPPWPRSSMRVHGRWIAAVRRGLAPDPNERWRDMESLLAELAYDPRKQRRRRVAMGSAGTALALGIGWPAYDSAASTAACELEGRSIDSVWNPEASQHIADAFAGTGIAYASDTWTRAATRVGAFADEWARMRTDVCLATDRDHTRSAASAERARACLDEHLAHLRNLAEQWRSPDKTVVDTSVTAAWSLPRLDECVDEAELARRSPSAADDGATVDIRSRLGQAAALEATGGYAEALGIAQQVLAQVDGEAVPQLRAEAGIAVGRLQERLGLYREARATREAAYLDAERAGDDEKVFTIAASLTSIVGARLALPEEAERWRELVELKSERLGLPLHHPAVGMVWNELGSYHYGQGRFEEARAAFQRALEAREQMFGAEHPEIGTLLNNIGLVQNELGRSEAALASLARALEIWEHAFGPEHPQVAMALNNLGLVHAGAERHAEALAVHARALEIREAALPPDHPYTAGTLLNIAFVHRAMGHDEAALAMSERARVIFEKTNGPQHPFVGRCFHNMGSVYARQRRYHEAYEAFSRALAVFETLTDHADVIGTLDALARLELERERPDAALLLVERGLNHRAFAFASPELRASLSFVHARALAGVGESERALERAREALALASSHTRPEIETWLQRFGAGERSVQK